MENVPPQLRVLSRNRARGEESGPTGCLFQPRREMEKDTCWQGGGKNLKKKKIRDFPGHPLVKTPHFHCRGYRCDLWSGN